MPWLALVLSGIAAAVYQVLPFPPAFTVLGPMIALYSLAAYAKRRTTALMALLVAGIFVSVPVFAFSFGVRWVAEVVGSFMLLAAAALLGDTTRSRREYVAEVEARAEEAERTREEEALRRVDEERMRIAREVHDVVAHSLSIVTVQAAAAEAVLDTDPAQARESMGHIRETSREALGELRSMLDVLRTGEAESPLAPAADLTQLERLVAGVREAGLAVDLTIGGRPCDGSRVRLGIRLPDRAGVAHQRRTARARDIGGRAHRRAPAGTAHRGARQRARRRPQRRRSAATGSRACASASRRSAAPSRPLRSGGWVPCGGHHPPAKELSVRIRVLIADDQALVRAGFRVLLDAADDIEVVGEAADGAEALRPQASWPPMSCSWTSACR